MTKVKICGLKTLADVAAVNDAQPELAGFVFAPSQRQISTKQAQLLRQNLSAAIQAVGVFVNPTLAQIKPLIEKGIIQLVQLHGVQDQKLITQLQQLGVKVIQAVQLETELVTNPDYVMFDGRQPGSGTVIDWHKITKPEQPLFLAGGLTPTNVIDGIETVIPAFVDVSSGVETNGKKDATKIMQFTRRAHYARNEIRN
ncbi:phosphoribosylanthranilate isomerase [Paucilactobacillus kaifaensis]|uniref:phosphoribosylanthranilate isomerase n=1 Tax=Paucilactobacillus kaifaensis TaxID=2559921 RepID=UPI0010F8FB66|nr:phosphoribosylanthranilate isomerase [Paucilactobacillus kaifaensis]